MPKVSIIVPVYQVEDYIEKCLQSLVNQTLQDIEIIIVNDGSTDGSESIIKKYADQYPEKIKYLKKENGGLSSARNYALPHATGDYLSFVDSDDTVSTDLYQNLESYMEQGIDLIKFKMIAIDSNGEKCSYLGGPTFEKISGEEAFHKLYVADTFLEVACIYLYRREFFLENQFKYTIDTYHEDFGLTPLVILKGGSVVSTDIYGYYYLQTENSITRTVDYKKVVKKAQDVLSHYDTMVTKIESYNISTKAKEELKLYATNAVILKAKDLKDREKNEYSKEIKKRKMYQNIKGKTIKQLIKRVLVKINVKLYLKMR